ncbi:MAG: hypothetical protein FWJ87_15450 [Micromonosporaceae bacterium]
MDGLAANLDQLLTCRDRLATLQADATNIAALARDADPEWYIWGAVGAPMAQIYWNFANDLHHHLELLATSLNDRVTTMDVTVQLYEAAEQTIITRLERAARGDSDVTNDPTGGAVAFSPLGVDVVRFDLRSDLPLISNRIRAYEAAVDGDVASVQGAAAALAAHLWALGTDPVHWLITAGLGFLVDVLQPIEDLLGLVTGNPERMAGEIDKWRRVSGALRPLAEKIRAAADAGLAGWEGLAADTARARLHQFADGVAFLAADVDRLAALMDIARTLMELIQQILIGLLAALVQWLIPTWTAAMAAAVPTAGASTAAAAAATTAQVSATTARATQFVHRLVALLKQIVSIIQKMASALAEASKVAFRPPGRIGNYAVTELGLALRRYLTSGPTYAPGLAGIGESAWRGAGASRGSGMSEEEIADRLDPDR